MSNFARIPLILIAFAATWMGAADASAQFLVEPTPEAGGLQLGKANVVRYRIGVEVTAAGGPVRDLYATMAIPKNWPEQSIRIVEQELTPEVSPIQYRDTDDAVRQMIVQIPGIPSGRTAKAILTLEITKKEIIGPTETDKYEIPRADRDLRVYLNASPYIESRDSSIRRAAREATAEAETPWAKAEAIYDYVRENVEYVNGPLKGARQALRDGNGDCEELSSLFIAMCRASDIPARTVWIPGHCYPEFYLVDAEGVGTWFPCQAAGDRSFGSMVEARPILQKGDSFSVPEKPRERIRYVADFLRGMPVPGGGSPKVVWVRDLLN